MFSAILKIAILICFVYPPDTLALQQVYQIADGAPFINLAFNSITLLDSNSNINYLLNTTLSLNMVGMWQVHDGLTNSTTYSQTFNTQMKNSTFNENYQHVTSIKRLGAADLFEPAITIYEGRYDAFPIGEEHHFTQRAWSGKPFPVSTIAVTGRSNWTLFEEPNFNGKAICFRSTEVFSLVLGPVANSTYIPSVVGSILKDCDTKNIAHEIDLAILHKSNGNPALIN